MVQNFCHKEIKLIVLDLDGTLLNSEKIITPATYAALEQAAAKGIHIVPCTGRFYDGMPEQVRSLPFVRYAITINGAEVYDVQEKRSLSSALISPEKADEVFSVLDTLPVIYDCYQDNWGWMDQTFYDIAEQYTMGEVRPEWIRLMRTPVNNFRQTIAARNRGVQKIQMFFQSLDVRAETLAALRKRFPELVITTALVNNIEINSCYAHKGRALLELCSYLGIDPAATMAFGDGLNDVTVLQTAALGVAMANADPAVKEVADYITDSNDDDGVAKAIRRFCFSK